MGKFKIRVYVIKLRSIKLVEKNINSLAIVIQTGK